MVFYLIWKDYDGYYTEEIKDEKQCEIRCRDIEHKAELDDCYGIEIIRVIKGRDISKEMLCDE